MIDLQNSRLIFFILILSILLACLPCLTHGQTPEINSALKSQDWEKAESTLLKYLCERSSDSSAFSAALALARTCIQLHKSPQAMEWLENACNAVTEHPEMEIQRQNMLLNLQRIYLTESGYRYNTMFRLHGVELDGPLDLVISDDHNLTILDRYRLITLEEREPDQFYPIPPNSTLPEDSRGLKLMENTPVIVTRYGYWNQHRIKYFGNPEHLSRVIDAVYTVDHHWLVIDRRNSSMLKFDVDGTLIEEIQIVTLNGDEKLTGNIFGGCWLLHPSSRKIITAGSNLNIQIPFRGPGYILNEPVDIASDNFGHLFVLCEDNTVTVFSPSGIRLRTIDLDPQHRIFRDVQSITINEAGKLYIADRKNHAVYCFN